MSFTSGALCLQQAVLTSLSDIFFSFVHIFPDALGISAKKIVMQADYYYTHSPSVTIFNRHSHKQFLPYSTFVNMIVSRGCHGSICLCRSFVTVISEHFLLMLMCLSVSLSCR